MPTGTRRIDDFLAEISKAAGLELEGWAGDWLHQPGTNAVTVDLNCEDGKITGMSILQSVSDRLDPFYFRAVAEGLLGTICDAGYLELVEQAVERSHTLHPSLAKRVRNLRFDIRRCLAIGEVLASPG